MAIINYEYRPRWGNVRYEPGELKAESEVLKSTSVTMQNLTEKENPIGQIQ